MGSLKFSEERLGLKEILCSDCLVHSATNFGWCVSCLEHRLLHSAAGDRLLLWAREERQKRRKKEVRQELKEGIRSPFDPLASDEVSEASSALIRTLFAFQDFSSREATSRYTYLITDGRFVKIGLAAHPSCRLQELQVGSPESLSFLAVVPGDHERSLHDHFIWRRVRGEWFSLTGGVQLYVWWLTALAHIGVIRLRPDEPSEQEVIEAMQSRPWSFKSADIYRSRGRSGGRPAVLSSEQKQIARFMMADPTNRPDDVARTLGVSRATLYRALKTEEVA